MATMLSLLASLVLIGSAWCVWTVIQWVWFRPRAIERCLRRQGLNGPPYRLLRGDTSQVATMARQAVKPIGLSDDFLPVILPFYHHLILTYGQMNEKSRFTNEAILVAPKKGGATRELLKDGDNGGHATMLHMPEVVEAYS